MMNKLMVAAFAGTVVVGNSAVAQANPTVPMTAIEDAATQLCGVIDVNPTGDGVVDGMTLIYDRGLDEIDSALVTLVAVHHACPQHESLIFGVLDQVVEQEVCGKPL